MAISDSVLWSGDAYDRLGELREAREHIDHLIEQAVLECRTNAVVHSPDVVGDDTRRAERNQPISWARIGNALGLTRQTAWERYRHLG